MRLRPELLLLAALACAPRGGVEPRPLPQPAVPLTDEEIGTVAGLIGMTDHRAFDSVRVAAALASPRAEVRTQAVLAAGRTGDLAAAALLRAATRDSSDEVAASAAFALGELADSSTTSASTLAALAGPLGWSRPLVAAEAAHALGKLGGGMGRAALWPALTGTPPSVVLQEALLAIWKSPPTPETVDVVLPHLAAADPEVRWRAAYALMRMGAPTSMLPLRDALAQDADGRVRAMAARALRAPAVDSADARGAATGALVAALDDADHHVAINAARALATYRDSAHVAPLAALLDSPDPNLAIAAAQALGDLGAAAARAPLEVVAGLADAPLALRAAALEATVRIAPTAGAAVATRWSADPDWLTRMYAARALAAAPWSAAQSTLVRLARDSDARVAAEALTAVAAGRDTVAEAYALYVEGLAAADVMVRASAARGLAPRARPMDLPLLLEAYQRASTDSLNDAALAIVQALGELQTRGTPVDRAFFVRFPRAADPNVRAAVARALGDEWGAVLPVETDRDPGGYEQVVRTLVAPVIAGAAPPRIRIETARGAIVLALDPVNAPLTVENFLALVRAGYYASPDLRWHRVVPNFVLQDGDPRGDGSGGPGHAIRDEMNRLRYNRGTLGMALSGPHTGGSQYFITHSAQPHLDGGYTVFGRVVEGMAVADAIVQGDPILAIEVVP